MDEGECADQDEDVKIKIIINHIIKSAKYQRYTINNLFLYLSYYMNISLHRC